ncbi:MAG: hypothetical protein KGY38_06485 [Desulfobacterales bacterium]|nr:hypothetical protein [Desulfobacterales bacterium]
MSEITSIQMGNKFNDVIRLDEYNGEISVVAAREIKDGKTYPQWVFPQDRDRKPRDKAIPLKVTLGDRETAARHLRYLADVLEAKTSEPDQQQGGQVDDNSDLPF